MEVTDAGIVGVGIVGVGITSFRIVKCTRLLVHDAMYYI